MVKVEMDIVETLRKCIDKPTQSCCSYTLFNSCVILWHLVVSRIRGVEWLATKEICERAGFRNCNEARTYLYRMKKKGLLKTSKLYDRQTIWRISEDILKDKHMDLRQLKRLLDKYYGMCKEYYKTGVLKKPKAHVEEEEELEEEWEEEEWEEE
jgi:hypothetical protein